MEGRNLSRLRGAALAAITGMAIGCSAKAETLDQNSIYVQPVIESVPATVTLAPTETPTFTSTPFTPEPTNIPEPIKTSIPTAISEPNEVLLNNDEQVLISAINNIRNQYGQNNLEIDAYYMNFAQAKTNDMAQNQYFSHRDINGRELYVDSIYAYCNNPLIGGNFAAENLGRTNNPDSINAIIGGWLNSPEHAKALIDPLWTTMGVGISKSQDGFTYFSFLGARGNCRV